MRSHKLTPWKTRQVETQVGGARFTGPAWRRHYKRWARRRMRRWAKADPENAPKQRRYIGYSD